MRRPNPLSATLDTPSTPFPRSARLNDQLSLLLSGRDTHSMCELPQGSDSERLPPLSVCSLFFLRWVTHWTVATRISFVSGSGCVRLDTHKWSVSRDKWKMGLFTEVQRDLVAMCRTFHYLSLSVIIIIFFLFFVPVAPKSPKQTDNNPQFRDRRAVDCSAVSSAQPLGDQTDSL